MGTSSPSLQQLNRTFIGSVLFIDIVGYSRRTVPDQLAVKEVFNALLTEAVETVAQAERIMVDTGDGAAVAFLGDPEDALFAALALRDTIDAGKVTLGEPGFVRMGINLGPLKMVRDINGHTNMIGDGVNDAQRVMSFAEPGQVMVSHSYFDIISRFSRDYTKLFVYEGTRHDKHVREHEVYRFGPAEGAEKLTEQLTEKMRDRSRARQPGDREWVDASMLNASFKQSKPLSGRPSGYAAGPGKKAWRGGLMAATAISLLGAIWAWTGKPTASQRNAALPGVASSAASVRSSASAAAQPDHPAQATEARTAPAQAAPGSAGADGPSTAKAPPLPAAKPAEMTLEKMGDKPAANSAEKPDAAPAAKPGTLKLAIQPWGEIYVDGSRRGVSPPMKSLNLAPGKHRIEIRNGQFAPYKQTVEVKSDGEATVRYVF
jgi:class 3 adenylate cyclase